jgi:large subunit ribosomal protein L25
MAKTHEILAQSRKDEGKGASRRLRRSAFVPAVVYGAGQAPESIQIEHNTILLAAKHEWFFSSVLDLNVDGKVQKVLVRDWQKHPFKLQMLHMDFQRINENEAIRVNVPIHFLNQEKSAAGKTAGVEISCLPKDLPEFIELDLTDLKPGDIVHLSELKLPANVEIVALHLGADHDVAVVTAAYVQEEVDAAPAAEGEGEAKPAADAASAKDAKK